MVNVLSVIVNIAVIVLVVVVFDSIEICAVTELVVEFIIIVAALVICVVEIVDCSVLIRSLDVKV
jgi:hypothetical protein